MQHKNYVTYSGNISIPFVTVTYSTLTYSKLLYNLFLYAFFSAEKEYTDLATLHKEETNTTYQDLVSISNKKEQDYVVNDKFCNGILFSFNTKSRVDNVFIIFLIKLYSILIIYVYFKTV